MKIGLTYDLRDDYLAEGYSEEETAEFDRPDTIEAIESALLELGFRTDRIGNAKQLIDRLSLGDRWDLVFNIAEGLHGTTREAQIPSILDIYQIPYTFSDPLVLSLCLHKNLTKMIVGRAGVATPEFALVAKSSDIEAVALPYPLFAKPVAEGTSKGIDGNSKILDPESLRAVCLQLLDQFQQPVLVETFLSGREFTVGLAGTGAKTKVLAAMEIHLLPGAEEDVYSYKNKELCEELVKYLPVSGDADPLVAEVERMAVAAWRALGCRDGGRLDIRCDGLGRPHFIEVNPLPGLHPHHSDLPILCRQIGISYVELIDRIVASARRRITKSQEAIAV